MIGRRLALILAGGTMVAACTPAEVPVEVRIAQALPAVDVPARGETAPVGTTNDDAADDPAIWRNPENPAASLIVATDKKAGLYVYGLDGRIRSRVAGGRLNNVDLVEMGGRVIVAASDRNDPRNSKVALYTLDTATGALAALGKVPSGRGEGYGICIDAGASSGDTLMLFAALKAGDVQQLRIRVPASGAPSGTVVRSLKLRTQIEGCAVDNASRSLFVGEEDVGIWRFGADFDAPRRGWLVARVDNRALVADVEGLAVVRDGGRGLLVASSQGENAFTVYAVPNGMADPLTLLGRFRVNGGPIGGTSETDGIELVLGDFGPEYPEGLFVAQDGDNAPLAQNFKLVGWREIKTALGL